MSIFKRVEVWILAVLLVGGAVFVLLSSRKDGAEGDLGGGGLDGGGRLTLVEAILERDYGNARLDLTVELDNRGRGPVPSGSPDTRLLTGSGDEVDPFFLAGDFPPDFEGGRRSRVTLKFWLKPEHFGGALTLDVRGDTLAIKSAEPFDLEALENGSPRTLGGAEW